MSAPEVTARGLVSRRNIYALSTILVGLLLIGTFADYAISEDLYVPGNQFGIFFAGYGEFPSFLGLTASGTLLVMASRDSEFNGSRRNKLLVSAAGVLLIVGTLFASIVIPAGYWPLPTAVLIVVGVVVSGTSVAVTWLVARNGPSHLMVRVAVVLFVVVAVQAALIFVL